jgi:hypothetical protein
MSSRDSNGDSNSGSQRRPQPLDSSPSRSVVVSKLGVRAAGKADGRGSAPFRRDCSQDCSQAAKQHPTHVDNSGIPAQATTGDGRSWTTCPLLRIRRAHTCKAGLPPRTPRRMGCRPRCFNPSLPTGHAAGSSLHQRGGTPHPEFERPRLGLQFTVVQRHPGRIGLGRWSSLNRPELPRPDLLMRHTVQHGSTATSPHSSQQHTQLAATTAEHPAAQLVRDEEAAIRGHRGTACDPRAIASGRPRSRTGSHGHSAVASMEAPVGICAGQSTTN